MMTPERQRRMAARGTALLLGVGAVFRSWLVPLARFTGDEASFWDSARRVGALDHLPVVGPEITGAPAHLPGGLFHYITGLPQLLGPSPFLGGVFMAGLHVLGGWMLVEFARRARGPAAGLVAAALWAFAPWDVLYGDRIWASCLAPVLGTFALWSASKARARPGYAGLAVFTCLVLPQVHLSAPIVWASGLVMLAAARKDRGFAPLKRPALIGAGAALASYLPYLVVELGRGFSNTRAILARSGGTEDLSGILLAPVKVLAYAILYGTAELGYHFERGYWGGGFDELAHYATADGLARWVSDLGAGLGLLVGGSVVLGFVGWVAGLARLRSEDASGWLDRAMTWSILVGLGTGAGLLMVARKSFFPHYANVLMPFALWPMVSGLLLLERRWGRAGPPALGVALGLSAAAMASNTTRYYLEVDRLNGLSTTLALLKTVTSEPGPVDLRFTHYDNRYAWHKLASGYLETPLRLDRRAPVRFIVHNTSVAGPDVPDEERVGPVRLTRIEPSRPPGLAEARWVASSAPEALDVTVRGAPGLGPCARLADGCRYGPHPWQRVRAEFVELGGRLERMVFMHPVSSATVAASMPVPVGVSKARLRFGLTDGAHRSTNRAPVQVTLTRAGRRLFAGPTPDRPGTRQVDLPLEPGRAPLVLGITTADDGARVFAFDVYFLD